MNEAEYWHDQFEKVHAALFDIENVNAKSLAELKTKARLLIWAVRTFRQGDCGVDEIYKAERELSNVVFGMDKAK